MKQEYAQDDIRFLTLLPLISRTVLSASKIRESGYTKTHLSIFAVLFLRDSLTMGQVARFISSSKEQATRAVAPLVDDGYVERYTDPDNRTKVRIRLTEDGIRFMENCRSIFNRNLHEALDTKVTAEEKTELFRAVDTMIRILGKLD